MTKEDKIKKAYGKHWENVKDFVDMVNGACCGIDYSNEGSEFNHPSLNKMGIFQEDNFAETWFDPNKNKHFWRPKSLDGITSNNGWNKIESDKDLPKQPCNCWVKTEFSDDIRQQWFNGFFNHYRERGKVTHYQIIVKPKPPIY